MEAAFSMPVASSKSLSEPMLASSPVLPDGVQAGVTQSQNGAAGDVSGVGLTDVLQGGGSSR